MLQKKKINEKQNTPNKTQNVPRLRINASFSPCAQTSKKHANKILFAGNYIIASKTFSYLGRIILTTYWYFTMLNSPQSNYTYV